MNCMGSPACFKGRISCQIQALQVEVWALLKPPELTAWDAEIPPLSFSALAPVPHQHSQWVIYIHTLTALLKPKEAKAPVSLPLPKMCYLLFNFTWPAEVMKGKGNDPVMYSKSMPCIYTHTPKDNNLQYNL